MLIFMKMFFCGEAINMRLSNCCVCIAIAFHRNFTYFGTLNYEDCYVLSRNYTSGYTVINIRNYSNTDQLLSFLLRWHRGSFILCNGNLQNWVWCIHVCLYDKRADVDLSFVHIMWVFRSPQHESIPQSFLLFSAVLFQFLVQHTVTNRFPFMFDVDPSLSSAT
jgi:hypothetical protein